MSISRRRVLQTQVTLGAAALGMPGLKAQAATSSASNRPTAAKLRVAPARNDAAELCSPSTVLLGGWLGERVMASAKRRLINVDTEPLLAGFQKKPGSHPWIGEHVGKWLHAATLAWANTSDRALRAKLDRVVSDLIAAQESDGYLGTYPPELRLGMTRTDNDDWDVWSHKYCLIGLLTYHQYTGDAPALSASRRAADLLLATFPSKRSILAAGTHVGMAATSVLEPMVLLYRITGDERYLDFARYIVKSWDEPGGPAIVKTLLRERLVRKVANGKAYEMLSNLVGLCEFARVTGEAELVQAARNAWQDIVDNRLYVTGTTSQWEYFQTDHEMRGDPRAHVGETCVTTTWIQFNLSLLQLTGEARFGDEIERSLYNHLSAAQHPKGEDWCYFTPLEGRKQYDKWITCCHSSGPRGMALAPQAAYLLSRAKSHDSLLVNTFETSRATLMLGGQEVTIEQNSGFPYKGQSTLTVRMAKPTRFAIKVRNPAWAAPLSIAGAKLQGGWAEVPARTWTDGDVLAVKFTMGSRFNTGEYTHAGRASLAWGPFVLAYESAANTSLPPAHLLGLSRPATVLTPKAGQPLTFEADVVPLTQQGPARKARFLTFADAGTDRGLFRVWMRAPGAMSPGPGESLLIGGKETHSRAGIVTGSINDDDFESLVTTADGQLATEDWFAVTLDQPVTARRVVFTHGRNSHDGGWFDTQSGKPRVQVQRSANGVWETVGEIDEYPDATATDAKKVEWWSRDSRFTLQLKTPQTFVALRVIGKPASGDNPRQTFVSCTELQAFSA